MADRSGFRRVLADTLRTLGHSLATGLSESAKYPGGRGSQAGFAAALGAPMQLQQMDEQRRMQQAESAQKLAQFQELIRQRKFDEARQLFTMTHGTPGQEVGLTVPPMIPKDPRAQGQVFQGNTVQGDIPHAPIQFPGGQQVQPQTSQEMARQALQEAYGKAQIQEEADMVELPEFGNFKGIRVKKEAVPYVTQALEAARRQAESAEERAAKERERLANQAFQKEILDIRLKAEARENALNRADRIAKEGRDSDKPLSAEASKVSSIAESMIPEIQQLRQAFEKDYDGSVRGIVLRYDRNLRRLAENVADKLGRLRSGGAINKEEEARFMGQIANSMDLVNGNKQSALAALGRLEDEAKQVLGKIKPVGTPAADPLGIFK